MSCIGQCKVCGSQEVLMTSWLMRSRVRSCLDKWKSTVIGQDTFTRDEQVLLSDLRTKRDLQPHDVGLKLISNANLNRDPNLN